MLTVVYLQALLLAFEQRMPVKAFYSGKSLSSSSLKKRPLDKRGGVEKFSGIPSKFSN